MKKLFIIIAFAQCTIKPMNNWAESAKYSLFRDIPEGDLNALFSRRVSLGLQSRLDRFDAHLIDTYERLKENIELLNFLKTAQLPESIPFKNRPPDTFWTDPKMKSCMKLLAVTKRLKPMAIIL